jgi:hypothetical protein
MEHGLAGEATLESGWEDQPLRLITPAESFLSLEMAGEDQSIKIYLHPDVSLFTRSVNAWSIWLSMHQQAL